MIVAQECYCIGDLHIKPDDIIKQNNLISFINTTNNKAVIFLVGDLFDYWVPNLEGNYKPFLTKLSKIARSRIIFFLDGNRDFLFSDVLHKYKIKRVGNQYRLIIGRKRILISHGDILFSNEPFHTLYSRIIRSTIVRIFIIPELSGLVKFIGGVLRKYSKGNQKRRELKSDNINFTPFLKYLQNNDIIITGHFHLFKKFKNNAANERSIIFLGEQTDSKLQYLHIIAGENSDIQLNLKEF